jgi:hypothetical protein
MTGDQRNTGGWAESMQLPPAGVSAAHAMFNTQGESGPFGERSWHQQLHGRGGMQIGLGAEGQRQRLEALAARAHPPGLAVGGRDAEDAEMEHEVRTLLAHQPAATPPAPKFDRWSRRRPVRPQGRPARRRECGGPSIGGVYL